MKKTEKIALAMVTALTLVNCGTDVAHDTSPPLNGRMQYAPTNHSSPLKEDFTALAKKYNFAELEKEYKSFSTKALADTYVKKMFNKFLIVTPNSVQVIRQVEFSRYLKNNGDTSYETSLKNIFTDTPVLYSSLTGMPAVQSKMTSESGTFGFYILGVSPNQTVPTALPATNITETSFTANWSAVTGATSYILIVDGVEITGITGTNRSVTGLQFGTSHTYKVKAVVSGVPGNESNQVSIITLLPAPVAGAATDIIATSFKANWSTVTNATGYNLYVSDGTITTTYSIPNPAITSHILTNLKFNKSYSYYVKSINALAESTSSNIVNVTTRSDAIIFQSNRDGNNEIYVMNADGTNQTRLTNDSEFDVSPSFSPDGSKISFNSDRDGDHEIYIMNTDGTNLTRLTNNTAVDFSPLFSPDGSKITFYTNRDGGASEIYVMNTDGTNPTRLTNNTASDANPSFSPDGSKIVFNSIRDGNTEIYIMNSDGTNQNRLTNNSATDSTPSFSPDGSKIAFYTNRDGNYEIYVMNTDGTNSIRLTNNTASDASPLFSSDGSKISFNSDRDGNVEVYVMNVDGTNQTRLTNNTASDSSARWSYLKTPVPVSFSPTSVTSDRFTANWGAMTGATGYKLFVDGIQVGGTLSSGTTSYAITGLTGTSHTYYVQAINAGGTSSPSNTVSVTLLPPIISAGLVVNLDAGKTASYSGTGTIWTDLSGNGNNGTLINGVGYDSANGGSLVFDGINDYVNCGNNSVLNTTDITASAWVYQPFPNSINNIILARYGGGSNGWLLNYTSENQKFAFDGRESGVEYLSSPTTNTFTNLNKWFNVTGTKSGNVWKIYVDGVLENTVTVGLGNVAFLGKDLLIGAIPGFSLYGKANIGSVLIYSRALSQSEITQNFNADKSRFGL